MTTPANKDQFRSPVVDIGKDAHPQHPVTAGPIWRFDSRDAIIPPQFGPDYQYGRYTYGGWLPNTGSVGAVGDMTVYVDNWAYTGYGDPGDIYRVWKVDAFEQVIEPDDVFGGGLFASKEDVLGADNSGPITFVKQTGTWLTEPRRVVNAADHPFRGSTHARTYSRFYFYFEFPTVNVGYRDLEFSHIYDSAVNGPTHPFRPDGLDASEGTYFEFSVLDGAGNRLYTNSDMGGSMSFRIPASAGWPPPNLDRDTIADVFDVPSGLADFYRLGTWSSDTLANHVLNLGAIYTELFGYHPWWGILSSDTERDELRVVNPLPGYQWEPNINREHFYVYSIWRDVDQTLPFVQGQSWPAYAGVAMLRGNPTPTQIKAVGASFFAAPKFEFTDIGTLAGITSPKSILLRDDMDGHPAGHWAYITGGNSVYRVETFDQENPSLSQTFTDATNLNGADGIAYWGDRDELVVTAPGDSRVTVVDWPGNSPDYTSTATVLGSVKDATNLNGASAVAGYTTYVPNTTTRYAIVCASNIDQITVVKCTPFTSPTVVGSVSSGTNLNKPVDLVMHEIDYAMVACEDGNSLTVVDVSTPTAPSISGQVISSDHLKGAHLVRAYTEDLVLVAALDGTDSDRPCITMVDITNKSAPFIPTGILGFDTGVTAKITRCAGTGDSITGMAVYGDFVVFTIWDGANASVRVRDLRTDASPNPYVPSTSTEHATMTLLGNRALTVDVSGNLAIHGTTAPACNVDGAIGEFHHPQLTNASCAAGRENQYGGMDVAYVGAYGSHTLMALDVTDPLNITELSRLDYPNAYAPWVMRNYGSNYLVVGSRQDPVLRIMYTFNPYSMTQSSSLTSTELGGTVEGMSERYGSRFLVCAGGRMNTVNASPSVPSVLGYYDTAIDARAVALAADIPNSARLGMVVGNHGLKIIDVDTNESAPSLVGSVSAVDLPGGSYRGVAYANGYVYTTHGSTGSNTYLSVIDVSDPANPSKVGTVSDPAMRIPGVNLHQWVEVRGTLCFVAASVAMDGSGGSFVTIDVSDPTNPTVVKISGDDFDAPSNGLQPMGLGLMQTTQSAIVGHWSAATIRMYGLEAGTLGKTPPTTELNLSLVGSKIDSTMDYSRDIVKVGDYCYVSAYYDSRIVVLDVSDPTDPTIVGNLTDTNLAGASGLFYNGGNTLFALGRTNNTFNVVDITDRENPSLTETFNDGGAVLSSPNDVINDSNISYVTGYRFLIMYYRASPYVAPYIIGSIPSGTLNNLGLMAEANGTVYAAMASANGLAVIDASNVSAPSVSGSVTDATDLNGAWGVAADGDHVFVTARYGDRLTVVDVSNPASPSVLYSLHDAVNLEAPRGIVKNGNYCYIACNDSDSVTVVDVSDISNMQVVTTISDPINDTLSDAEALVLGDGFVYVAAYGLGVISMDWATTY